MHSQSFSAHLCLELAKRKVQRKRKDMPEVVSDDDDLVCEICKEKETVHSYCVKCVDKHLQVMSMFSDHWDISERNKEYICELICENHRRNQSGVK